MELSILKPKIYSQPVMENFTLVTTNWTLCAHFWLLTLIFKTKHHITFSDRVVYIFTVIVQNWHDDKNGCMAMVLNVKGAISKNCSDCYRSMGQYTLMWTFLSGHACFIKLKLQSCSYIIICMCESVHYFSWWISLVYLYIDFG